MGLAAGVLGACAGAVVAYIQLQPLLEQRAQYKTFQSLVTSGAVQKEVESLRTTLAQGCTKCRTDPKTGVTLDMGTYQPIPQGATIGQPQSQPIDISAGLVPKAEPRPRPKGQKLSIVSTEPIRDRSAQTGQYTGADLAQVPPPATLPASWFDEVAAVCGDVKGWNVNRDGIKTIYFNGKSCASPATSAPTVGPWAKYAQSDPTKANPYNAYGGQSVGKPERISADEINLIETADGRQIYKTDPPTFRSYLLLPVFPVLGFFLPWGVIRTLTWIGVGFYSGRT